MCTRLLTLSLASMVLLASACKEQSEPIGPEPGSGGSGAATGSGGKAPGTACPAGAHGAKMVLITTDQGERYCIDQREVLVRGESSGFRWHQTPAATEEHAHTRSVGVERQTQKRCTETYSYGPRVVGLAHLRGGGETGIVVRRRPGSGHLPLRERGRVRIAWLAALERHGLGGREGTRLRPRVDGAKSEHEREASCRHESCVSA